MAERIPKVREVSFDNPRLSRLGVEIIRLAELRRRVGRALELAERPGFYLLILVRSGAGRHMVDFVEYPLRGGDMIIVRPGQVQQWRLEGDVLGELVLFAPEVLTPYTARSEEDVRALRLDEWPARSRLRNAAFAQALASTVRLRQEVAAFDGSVAGAAIVRHELLAMLLRLSREQPVSSDAALQREAAIHRSLVRELEKQFHTRTSVAQLAGRLGYSESTVFRACIAVSGLTAKEVVDRRVALEAKRLLVHTQASTAAISRQLGFSEPTNFGKFFRRVAGTTPLAFREQHRVR